jgi:hypothetical protein
MEDSAMSKGKASKTRAVARVKGEEPGSDVGVGDAIMEGAQGSLAAQATHSKEKGKEWKPLTAGQRVEITRGENGRISAIVVVG